MKFELLHQDKSSKARVGTLSTNHGEIGTPIFMPVGTQGSVKTIHQTELKEDTQAEIILGNTYHLYLRPGTDVLKEAGGLHKFINWDRPILTDSGGYQVYSLADARKITEKGVKFQSHIDGHHINLTPEYAMEVQRIIGADILMAFDECTPYPCEHATAKSSMELTHRWLLRCQDWLKDNPEHYSYKQSMFPIVQGSVYKDLRKTSAEFIADQDAPGNAIGGLSVGEPAHEMYEMTNWVTEILPKEKPRYLMGVGTPANILENIALGIDMFDCVMPTRNARNGMLFTWQGSMNIKNSKWKYDFSPLDESGSSYVDRTYSKAYLRHLFVADEYLAKQIASLHNLRFYLDLTKKARQKIWEGDFFRWKNEVIPLLNKRR